MKKSKFLIIFAAIGIVILIFALSKKSGRIIPLATSPFTQTEILHYLNNNYDEKFAIKQEITLDENTKDKVYIAYPVNNQKTEFFVVDEFVPGSISLGGIERATRELGDTYTNTLLSEDIAELQKIYPDLSIEKYDKDEEYFISSLTFGSYKQTIVLSFSTYSEVDNICDKYIEVYNYVKNNISKYKTAHTIISIETKGVYSDVKEGTPPFQGIKDNIVRWLIHQYREEGNDDIFNIPADLKKNYPVEDIGWGNSITKVYLNDKSANIEQYTGIKMFYTDGCLQISIGAILELIPQLKSSLKSVDYKSFDNLNKISSEEKIMMAYEKDNNIYILTENDGGYTYIYKYKNLDITRIEWNNNALPYVTCDDEFRQRLNKYFGITTSYDYEKEILYIMFAE